MGSKNTECHKQGNLLSQKANITHRASCDVQMLTPKVEWLETTSK